MLDFTGPEAAPLTKLTALQATGPSSNRVNIVFLGDGYTEGEIATAYNAHVASLMTYLFSGGTISQPFGRYANFFNVYAVNVVSRESGADDKEAGVFRDTALGARYYFDGQTERLLYVDHLVADAALRDGLAGTGIRPDMRFISVNSAKYGGGGGYFAVYSGLNGAAQDLALHEVAHSFVQLADHYTGTGSGGQGGQRYTGPEPIEPDVTRDPSGAKWAEWIGHVEPGMGPIGAYEGARYFGQGIYRPSLDSKMLSLGRPFDAVGRQAFVLGFYRLVDPLDGYTPNLQVLNDPAKLAVDTIDPALIRVRWAVNGVQLSDGALEEIDPRALNLPSGTHAFSVLAYDPTEWVRGDRSLLEQRVNWSVVLTVATMAVTGELRVLQGGPLVDRISGGALEDTLSGGDGADHITGAAGNDRLFGQEGADLIGGQEGDDFIDGGAGADTLFGDAGRDHIVGGSENDRLFGQEGDDLIGGQGGDDFIDGGAGADTLYGDEGPDHMIGGSENDRLHGGDGGDLIGGQDGDDFIDGGAGADTLYGDAGRDHMVGGTENDRLHGNEGDDLIGGQDGDDFIDGGSGADALYGDAGRDHMVGGSENDRLHGGDGDDLIGGQDGDDFIDGGPGADSLFGDAGRDHMVGGSDNDRLHGNEGDDLIGGQDGDDFIDGGAGNDSIYGDAGNDRLVGGLGDDRIDGGAGLDFAVFSGPRSSYVITTSNGVTTVAGQDGTDTLFGIERLEFADGVVDAAPMPDAWVV